MAASNSTSEPRPDPKGAPQPAAAKPADETIKETFESIIIAFILAFVFRAYVVEAFVIPTGSMAPTLLGEHLDVTCGQCGYRFSIGVDDREPGDYQRHRTGPGLGLDFDAICPMCHHANRLRPGTRIGFGDRILVHKYIYSILEPRRWDVVVFKNPQTENQDRSPGPSFSYIKRLIGLPNESVCVIDGNVYVRPAGAPEDGWRIARKTDRPNVQRAVWQPLYHSQYVPLDGGHGPGRGLRPWQTPWVAESDGNSWDRLEGQRSYRHRGTSPGAIRFDFARAADGWVRNEQALPVWYPYNEARAFQIPAEPIEDVRVAAAFQPESPGLAVTLRTTALLDNPAKEAMPLPLSATIDASGHATLETVTPDGQPRPLRAGEVGPFAPGVARQVELWYVDQEASLWVDGKRILRQPFDLPSIDDAANRRPPPLYPRVSIEVSGAPVTLDRVELDRDIYYSSQSPSDPGWHQATRVKLADGRTGGDPIHLESDEFFCMGDNSPLSADGRFWKDVHPWILEQMLQGHAQTVGVVPRQLMMGRAFFVYFPAPFSWAPEAPGIIPNFGDMRFIH